MTNKNQTLSSSKELNRLAKKYNVPIIHDSWYNAEDNVWVNDQYIITPKDGLTVYIWRR